MNLPSDLGRLQQVANYSGARKTLRTGAIGSLVFGALGLALGFVPPASAIPIAVGVMLLATGIWNLTRPQPAGIVIDGITLLVVGVYNLSSIAGGHALWVKLGIFQVFWGIQGIRSYARFRSAFAIAPQDSELEQFKAMADGIRKSRIKESDDVIEFTTSAIHTHAWKAQLADRAAVIVSMKSAETHVVPREHFNVSSQGRS